MLYADMSEAVRISLNKEATKAVAAGLVVPHRCAHHTTYPDSDGFCMGEPANYCENYCDAYARVHRLKLR